MTTCEKCLLSDNMPSVRIDNSGLCNYCTSGCDSTTGNENMLYEDNELTSLLEKNSDRDYQVIMAYSGGKDSTYTLKLIRERYKASILAVTFNNGFLSDSSIMNISRVTDYLGVDSIIVKYPAEKMLDVFRFAEDGGIFPKTSLERASSICNMCIMMIKNMIYHEAIIRCIPIICFGWTPGQVGAGKPLIKLNYRMVSKVFENTRCAVKSKFGSGYDKYFINEEFMEANEDRMPYLYYPFVNNAYNEGAILDEIMGIGWKLPENTDGNSSNCLLNSYANQSHMDRFGFHPYAFEISNMVRSGYMTREEGMKKLDKVRNDTTYEQVRSRFQKVGGQNGSSRTL